MSIAFFITLNLSEDNIFFPYKFTAAAFEQAKKYSSFARIYCLHGFLINVFTDSTITFLFLR